MGILLPASTTPLYCIAKSARGPRAAVSPAMTHVQTTKLLGYSWSDLFDLVLDVQSYPQFVPYCRDVRLLSHRAEEPGKTIVVSRMIVGFSVLEVGYTNRATGDAIGRQISVEALDGPLRYLRALWRFEPRDDKRTQLHFSVNYEFSNPLFAAVASRVFAAMFSEILTAFERRAARLLADTPSAGTPRLPEPTIYS
jgi:coenzyme Q-binding protein COQ10